MTLLLGVSLSDEVAFLYAFMRLDNYRNKVNNVQHGFTV